MWPYSPQYRVRLLQEHIMLNNGRSFEHAAHVMDTVGFTGTVRVRTGTVTLAAARTFTRHAVIRIVIRIVVGLVGLVGFTGPRTFAGLIALVVIVVV